VVSQSLISTFFALFQANDCEPIRESPKG